MRGDASQPNREPGSHDQAEVDHGEDATVLRDQPAFEIPACPECGAPIVNGLHCWEQLGAIIAWEADDPALLAEHFFTVAAFNLQHPAQLTDAALADLRAALIDRIDHGVSVGAIRQRMARRYAGKHRVRKPAAEQRRVLRRWSITIADVYFPDQSSGAAERVRRWAAAIRSEL